MFEKKKSPTATDRGWFTIAEMCEVFDITPQGFSKSVRPLLADADIRNEGTKDLRIRCRAAIDAWAAKKAEQAAAEATKKSDPLLVGSDSPALEKYREHRAGLAEIELQQKRGSHVNLQDLNQTLTRFASLIRRAGETLLRRFGNDAADILNESIDQAEQTLTKELKNGTPNAKP